MAVRKSSNSDVSEAAPTGSRRKFWLLPLRGPGDSMRHPLPCNAWPGHRSPEEKATGSVEQAVGGRLPQPLRRLGYYGLALLLVAAAALLRWMLRDILSAMPFLVFYLAWVGAAALGGLGPGLLATVASWLCVDLLFDPTPWHIGLNDTGSVGRLAVLLAGGLVISIVGEKMRRARTHERRQTEKLTAVNAALRESEEKYRFLVENSKNVTWTMDLQGKWTFISSNVEKATGYRADEVIGKTLWDFLAPECHDLVQEKLRRRVRGEDLPSYEAIFVGKDGRHTPFEVLAAAIVDDGGNIVGVQGVSRDITERKRAQEAVAESRKRYHGLVEKINDWVWEIDANCVYTYSSPRALELLGYPPEEIVGKTPFDFMPPAEVERVWNAFHPLFLERKPLELLENTLVRKDGRRVTVETSGRPVFAEDGSFLGYTGIDRDVTSRKGAEETLRRSEERLRLALASGGMGEWEWDLRTDSLFWCERIYQLLGLDTFHQARLETFLNRVHAADREDVRKLLAEAVNERKDLEVEFRILRSGQEPRSARAWLAFHATVIRDEQGQALRMIGVMYDITPRKQMEEELRRLNNLLTGEVQARTEELKDTAIRLQAEVVRRASVEDELRERSQMLEAFFRHTVTPLAFLDTHFHYVRINQAYAEAARKDPEYFVAKNFFALHPNEEDRLLFEQVVQTQRPYHAYAKPFDFGADPQTSTRYWNWLLTPLFDTRGQVQFLVLTLENVTERQKAFQELAHRARQLQMLTLELSEVEERERERLAEILHDDLQQTLTAAKFHLGLVSHRCKGDKRSWETAEQAKQLLTEAIGQSRSLSHELSPPGLTHNDLGETFEWLADQVKAKHGLTVYVDVADRMEVQSGPLKALLYRAAQELLFNIAKHARVPEARLRLRRRRESIYLLVSDKGCGFDPQQLPKSAGFGLLSIRERIDLLGGRMKVRSAKGKGSTFLVVVPDGASTRTDG